MSRPMAARPNLDQLKRQAKELLKSQREQDPVVCPVLRRLHRFAAATDAQILQAPLTLSEAQYALAMDYGFPSWNALRQHALSAADAEAPESPVGRLQAAVVSFQVRSADPDANLATIEGALRAHPGVQLFVFPELSVSGWPLKVGGERDYAGIAEPVPGGPSTARVAELARRYRAVICAGLVEECEGRFFFTHFLCGPEGYLGKQRMLFPTRGLMSYGVLTGGRNLRVFDLFGYRCVILAAADWTFPEGPYLAGLEDAALIIAPSDQYDLANVDTMRHVAGMRMFEYKALILVAFGGPVPTDPEVPAGLVPVPASDTGAMALHYETRRLDEVKVIPVDLALEHPQSRWGRPRDRAPVLLGHLAIHQEAEE